MDTVTQTLLGSWDVVRAWATSVAFYVQVGAIAVTLLLALLISVLIKKQLPIFATEPEAGPSNQLRRVVRRLGSLLFLILTSLLLGAAIEASTRIVGQAGVVRFAQGGAVLGLLYAVISRFIGSSVMAKVFMWVAIPLVTLRAFGWLDDVTGYLDTVSLEVGSIRLSVLAVGRTVIFSGILFWLGRVSSSFGSQVIRSRETLDIGTREVVAKLFEIGLYVVIFLLLLGVMGINLTALAVFGGALGVGLGFGLQQIAANFISGIIILLDRSITPGDYIAFDDGRAGTLRDLKMRFATLETFDGKDIMVPNEQFITTSFVNWTHKNKKQRYSLEFSVAYKTDLREMIRLVREVVASHPKVLSGPDLPIEERPDAEISSFGDSGVNILVEFWMEGIDDGKNRVGADLLMMIWDVLHEHGIEIPFPQREVKILNADTSQGR